MRVSPRDRFVTAFFSTAALFVAACGGTSSTSSSAGTGFLVQNVSVQQGELNWRINRPIDVTFTKDVDFSTVNLNTIRLTDDQGQPATGVFIQPLVGNSPDRRRVRFQPSCPTRPDFSDAGFSPMETYTLVVQASTTGGVTVRATDGSVLKESRSVTFQTPDSVDASDLFLDAVAGPPAARLRGAPGIPATSVAATHLQLGGDPTNRVYFVLDPATQQGRLPLGFEVPLNKYSDVESQVAVVLHINQPIAVSPTNLSSDRVTLQFNDTRIGAWVDIPTDVSLLENCTSTGAALRVVPRGLLPQGVDLRVNIRQGFSDLAGQSTTADVTGFARMSTLIANNVAATSDPRRDADGLLEPFLLDGNTTGSREDLEVPLVVPRANWGGGLLEASFDFEGSGGAGGAFDWVVPPSTTLVIDTTSGSVSGPSGEQSVINGRIDVRNVDIPSGSKVIFQGPNPVSILASGTVTLGGEISLRGNDARGVNLLNATNVPEAGASGQAGGGAGGVGSFLTAQSTPRGGRGNGAFSQPNRGGQGGETGFALAIKDDRRAAGGGGGVLGKDVLYPFQAANSPEAFFVICQTLIGMDAEPGFTGGPLGLGAVSQTARAAGGMVGISPFVDGDPDNDFFGSLVIDAGTLGERIVVGELSRVWAGAGGGAGGDAVDFSSFPLVPFDVTGDEKGAGGGGGSGGLRIFAIGPIVVQNGGRIVADGGNGAGGESSEGFDRVGGGSGGGSGGHIVLSSASYISISGQARSAVEEPGAGPFYNDRNIMGVDGMGMPVDTGVHSPRAISALGGQGGAGHDDEGGAGANGRSQWGCDAIPFNRIRGIQRVTSTGTDVTFMVPPEGPSGDPLLQKCYDETLTTATPLIDLLDPAGPVLGAGGDGGPGIIQLHVPDPALNLRFPLQQSPDGMGGFTPAYGAGLDVTEALAPPPLGWNDLDDADTPVPFFGAESISQSRWIPLGLAKINPDPSNPGVLLADDQVVFRFEGTDDGDGTVDTGAQSTVLDLAPIVGPANLMSMPATPFIEPTSGGGTIVFDATGLSVADQIYAREVTLLRGFSVLLSAGLDSSRFFVEDASLEIISETPLVAQFRVSVATDTGSMDDFVAGAGGPVQASLIPSFFRVVTNDVLDTLPPNSAISVFFDATVFDPLGQPDPDAAFSAQLDMGVPVGFTPDISELNAQSWDFFRFRVMFDLDTADTGVNLNSPRPGLRFLRIPFQY